VAIWTGVWEDLGCKPFDPNYSGPRDCSPHVPTHVIRRGTRRSPGQDAMIKAAGVLAARFWPALTPLQKAMYGTPVGGFGPTNRSANYIVKGGWPFFLNANAGCVLFGDHYFTVSTNDKVVPVRDLYLDNHNPAARQVDLHFQYLPEHPPGFSVYTDLHFSQVNPRRYHACKTWFWTRTFHVVHLTDQPGTSGWQDYARTLTYPKPVSPDSQLGLYARIRGPDFLPSTMTLEPIPLVPT